MPRYECLNCKSIFQQPFSKCPVCGAAQNVPIHLEKRLLPFLGWSSITLGILATLLIVYAVTRDPGPGISSQQHLGQFVIVLLLCGLPPLVAGGIFLFLARRY